MADEEVARRLGQLTVRSGFGADVGPVTKEEWDVFRRVVREMMVPNWQRLGVLPPTQDPLDLTPTDVMDRYYRWLTLAHLYQDPLVPWQDGQSLGALLKTCGDRLPIVKRALLKAGIDLPDEWEPSDDQ